MSLMIAFCPHTCLTNLEMTKRKGEFSLPIEAESYMKISLKSTDWLLQCKDGTLLPCHSVMLCNISPVLHGLGESIGPDKNGKTIVPFPGKEKEARALLSWVYDQQKSLIVEELPGLVTIAHAWDIKGGSPMFSLLSC